MAGRNEIDIVLKARDEASKLLQEFAGPAGPLVKLGAAAGAVVVGFEGLRRAAGEAFSFLKESVSFAIEAEETMHRLETTVNLSGSSFEALKGPIGEALESVSRFSRFARDDAAKALQVLTFI